MTVVTADRVCLFGVVAGDQVDLSGIGRIVRDEWQQTSARRESVELDEFVVMPNHLHGIVWLTGEADAPTEQGTARRAPTNDDRSRFGKPAAGSLSTIVGAFKSAVSRRARIQASQPRVQVWQRGFYERVVRDEAELLRIREYVIANPRLWAEDEENPRRTP